MKNLLFSLLLITPGLSLAAVLLPTEGINGVTTAPSDSISTSIPYSSELTKADHPSFKLKKPGLLKQFRAIKALKKEFRAKLHYSENISTLAWVALGIFSLSLIMGIIASSLPVLAWPSVILFLASNGLAIAALIKDDNRKTRILAWSILITSMILTLLAIILLIIALVVLASIF